MCFQTNYFKTLLQFNSFVV